MRQGNTSCVNLRSNANITSERVSPYEPARAFATNIFVAVGRYGTRSKGYDQGPRR
jgi:hypothetical protein